MKHCLSSILIAGLILAVPSIGLAVNVSLTADDGFGTSSFNTAGSWDDANVPTAGNDYFNNSFLLRTPADANSYTFAGDSLTITGIGLAAAVANDALMWKGSGTTSIITIDNLTIDGGQLRHGQGDGDSFTLAGNLAIGSTGANFATQGGMIIEAPISGSSTIRVLDQGNTSTARMITLASGANTFTGDIELYGSDNGRAHVTLADGANLNFVIGDNGINNSVFGTGTITYNGVFVFDFTGANITLGNSWDIAVAGVQSYGATFTVSNSTGAAVIENSDGSWYLDDTTGSGGKFLFHTDTGILESVSENTIPITTANITPVNGSIVSDPNAVISITLIDGLPATVDTNTVSMTVSGIGSVSPSVTAAGSGSNLVSYTPTLTPGNVDVQVTYQDNSAKSYTNSWSFIYKLPPANSAVNLWNVNIAGAAGGVQQDVTNGTVVLAPSTGSDQWNNISGSNSVVNTFGSITDASGANPISVETSGPHNWGEKSDGTVLPQLFYGWAGANANADYDLVISGLDTNATYDLYVYSTWHWTQNDCAYHLTQGTSAVSNAVVTLVTANVADAGPSDYSGLVEGENYYVFTEITPSLAGHIALHIGDNVDTICNGFQLVQRPAGGPAYAPVINSIAIAGGMVTINWSSDAAGTYQIESKTDLTGGSWTPVAGQTGLSGGTGIDSSFSASGDPAEFFQVKGE